MIAEPPPHRPEYCNVEYTIWENPVTGRIWIDNTGVKVKCYGHGSGNLRVGLTPPAKGVTR